MEFRLDQSPPLADEIDREKELLNARIKKIRNHDLIITSILILASSTITALAVYWLTDRLKYAAISAAVYPIISVVLHFLGITTNTGFRSSAQQLIELNNSLIALKTIPEDNEDIETLSSKYEAIADYANKVKQMDRGFINGELAMFWGWDASTQAKTARARSYVNRARKSIQAATDDSVDETT